MNDSRKAGSKVASEQPGIRNDHFHPRGDSVEFPIDEVETSIPARFEKIARMYPERLAVKEQGRSLRYDELDRAADCIARAILEKKGERKRPIALLFENGADAIAAILGVLKAGRFYVALDPHFPPDRLRYILRDSSARLLVANTQQWPAARSLGSDTLELLNIDEIGRSVPSPDPLPTVSPHDLAELCYTSGSEGSPKGVLQTHRGEMYTCWANQQRSPCVLDDRLSLIHSLSFGSAKKHLHAALLSGASLFLFDVKSKGVLPMARWLEEERITILHTPPALFRQLAEYLPHPSRLGSLRLVYLSGAPITKLDFDLYRKCLPRQTLLGFHMASTEARAICSAVVDREFNFPEQGTPAGYSLPGKKILLVDDAKQEVATGEVGEIAVKSRFLTLEYWNSPDLTRTKFLADPEGGDEAIVLTGDLGKQLSDGFVVHLGRKDLMVKIRGYRVDIGEVENALLKHPMIKETGVAAWDREPGEKYLVGYIVLREESDLNVGKLRKFLRSILPEFMIPSAFVFLSSLPSTNGKVDRNALPNPDKQRPERITPYAPPRNDIERQLATIWEEVLDIRPIGAADDFFDLGGHSLSATRLISQVIKYFQLEIPLKSLFQSPTVGAMATVILEHRERKLNDRDGVFAATSFRPPSRKRDLPLSFAQERMWFLNQLEPDSAVYNQFKALSLRGTLDRDALQKALDAVMARHEVLRTTYSSLDGQPFQDIHETANLEFCAVDLRDFPDDRRTAELDRHLREFSRRPFDLEKDWPLRAALLRLAEEEHVLLVVTHHIASDGWSNEILYKELTALYEAFCHGRGSPLTDLAMQYADYAVGQKVWLQGEVLEEKLRYWKQRLAGVSPMALPTDHPRPAEAKHLGLRKRFRFPRALAQGLKDLSRQANTTLFMTLLAAFQALLHRYTHQDDIVVGCPIAGRTRVELEGLIGFFVNTLVLRNDLSGNPTFRELSSRVRSTALDAYAHQDVPFEKLVEELQPPRDLSRNPFFQVMFQLRNYPSRPLSLGDLTIEEYEFGGDTAKFDLALGLRDDPQGLSGSIEFRTDLFEPTTIERMVGHFQALLEGIVADSDRRIDELWLLGEAEKHQLLVACNDTQRDYPTAKCIHNLIEAQVQASPDAVAVVFEDHELSYAELNRRANRLARHLAKLGVGPDAVVGLCLERSLEMIIALLGILKAGGAYVPLDPASPRERLAVMAETARLSVVVTEKNCLDRFDHAAVVCLQRDWPEIAGEGDGNFEAGVTARNLAYVIYTSGSTGTPKGVAVEHRALVNYSCDIVRRLAPAAKSSFAMVQPLTVDSCITMIFPALMTGGVLHIVSRENALNAAGLGDYFERCSVDFLKIAPSHLAALQAVASPERLMPRRGLIVGGESSRRDWVRSLQALAPGCTIYNHYGPTETTVGVLMFVVRQAESSEEFSLTTPLGRPLANTQAYILDNRLRPVPIGVTGELYIGGDGLARGYLNQPHVTAESFIANPFSPEPAARLYKTGDIVRYLPDGNIEFLGRCDDQIKVRGFRVEPAEIEAALVKHHDVGQAVVMPEGSTDAQALIAYVVPAGNHRPSASELRRFLRAKLPDYMVPSVFLLLDALPQTAHGKLDRRALPPPDRNQQAWAQSYAAPRTRTEKVLARIWSELLRKDEVGIDEDFFDLGGHSLLAIQLISRIRDAFGLELPLRSIFEASTLAEFAARISSADAKKAAWKASPISPEALDRQYPLSFTQKRFWFLEQLEPNNSAYKAVLQFHIEGELDAVALEKSLAEIVRRHEILRTTFHLGSSEPVQMIPEQWSFRISNLDLSREMPVDLNRDVERRVEDEHRRPFDLSADLLLRAVLLRLGPNEHVLSINSHHIVWDHWCMDLFFRELSVLYQAFSAGQPSPLSELPIQYKQYARWQRDVFGGVELEGSLAYWKRQLRGAPPSLDLPTDHPRKPLRIRRGGRQSLVLPPSLSDGLRTFSRQSGVTLFMTFLAVFQTLLHRLTGQDDIVVGTPVAGRDRSETEGLIGLFLNSLALRTDLSGNPSFRELLGRVREVAVDAYEHQDLPFERLVEELRPPRDLTRTPIFQVFINMYNFNEAALELDRLTVKPMGGLTRAPQFDLEFYIREHDDGIHLTLAYDADLFDAATSVRMIGQLQVLLDGVVTGPDRSLSELPLLTDAERHQLLVEWNGTKRDYPKDRCIHQIFEAQVERTPDAIALVFEGQQLTYRELNRRANQLAHYLRKLGVGPEALVGICLERSPDMIVGILGILKAGGAYMPLEPSYPKERLAFMLEDSRAGVVITQSCLVETLPAHKTTVLCLDRDARAISTEEQSNPPSLTLPNHLAYVIYTSGSTGTPKGVLIEHHNVARLFRATDSWFHFGRDDVWTLFHSFAFDFSVWELWGALFHGGRLVIVPVEVSRSPREFYELLCREQVTVLNQTPSAFRQLVQAEESRAAAGRFALRLVIFGGEALDFQSLRPWFERHGDHRPQLINMYGITETTVHVTYRAIKKSDLDTGRSSLIGEAIPDLELYLLDQYRNPVPIGVPGELYVGGAGLARGYLNRDELTAERFIVHFFGEGAGRRLYRSGDLVRRRIDGDLEYLGRIDDQVKIRGYRIELGEIETALVQHPAVESAVVAAREDEPGDRRLVAYVVAVTGHVPSASELRSFLQRQLLPYMIPSMFIFLESLPLTANGKLDRKALPPPTRSLKAPEQSPDPARKPTEELLAGIWAEILKVDEVGIHDNFFERGGHSLLAAQLMSRIADTWLAEIPLRSLFESPTIAGLAERIDQHLRRRERREALPILADARARIPLSFAQQRLWFLDQYEPNSSLYNVPGALRLEGALDVAALEQSLNEIVRRHEALRTTFLALDGEPIQRIAPVLRLSLPIMELAHDSASEREHAAQRLAREQMQKPFDLSQGPLLRMLLIRLGTEDHILVLTMHHIVSDGWSRGVFYRELSLLYQAYTQGSRSPLGELPIQYADFAVWQREWLQGEVLENQLSYWKSQLAGVPALLHLPADRPRPHVQSFRGARESIELSEEMTRNLKALSRRHDVTLYMTLLAAFQTLLHRRTGQDDIVVGSPIANRNRTEIEGLIGFFANTLALRSNLAGNPTFAELLARTREVALAAYAHQDLPFEKLVEELQPERNLGHSPLFQVMFVLQEDLSGGLQMSGLSVNFIPIESGTTKFDLLLSILDSAGRLRASMEYSTDLFDAATIQRMLDQWRILLAGVAADPQQRIEHLPILTEAEQLRLVEWNKTQADYPRDKCIHELFDEQARKLPEEIALVFESQRLTYRELNQRANRLAHHLQELGVGPEKLVGLSVERSPEMVIGLLGILKAGGAYVPLDPDYPKERIAFMLADTQASVLLTTRRLLERLPEYAGRVVCLDAEWRKASNRTEQAPASAVTAQSLAYAIYTSGSTGKPKAVAISHRSLCNLLAWQLRHFANPAPARTLQFASLSFDVSFQEMFTTWCSGGTLVLIPEALRGDSVGLLRCLRDQSVERLFLPFVALQQFAEAAGQEESVPESLREIITAGEQLQVTPPIMALFDKLEHCHLINQYGPSESHVVTAFTLTGPPHTWSPLPSVGRPINNTEIFLLDRYLNPVALGAHGEIYIGGDSLARGYLNRPDLTAERFIPSPIASEPGARLYKTGDLARYRPDGNIEFLGRIDDQVKIRGYRIELGEIETALVQHPAVETAVAAAREDEPGDRRLVAYIVALSGHDPSIGELRSFLQQRLPEYMIPSAFVALESLPLLPNGKLDRKALPAPDASRADLDQPFAGPRTPVEESLCKIWADVLKRDEVGIHDNFFELGGHSLLATRVMSRVRQSFQIEMALRTLFEHPSVAGLAGEISRNRTTTSAQRELMNLLNDLESLSEEEVGRRLSESDASGKKGD